MGIEKQQVHRAGAFKQSNKEHKHGRHRSKGSISVATKGKVSIKSISKKNKRELNRDQRRNQSVQIRQKKREEVLCKKRAIGEADSAPFLVCILPLNKEFDPSTAVNILCQCDDEVVVNKTDSGVIHILLPRFKKKYSFIIPPKDNYFAVLDCLKVSDTAVFLISASAGVDGDVLMDQWGTKLLASSFGQGLPTPVFVATDLESIAPKKRHDAKQAIQKLVHKYLPEEKLMVLDKSVDALNILRRIGNQKRKTVPYRDRRPHLYGEEVLYVPDTKGTYGTLQVKGYLRGTPLSVNQLVHIPGLGDFQMSEITRCEDPNQFDKIRKAEFPPWSEKCDPAKQESLDAENVPDPMDAEQTWPNQDDFEMAENEEKLKKVKKVPKGWSDYQASWIPDDDAEFQADEDDDDDDDDNSLQEDENEFMDAKSDENSEQSDAEANDDNLTSVAESEAPINDDRYDNQMDFYAEQEELKKLKEAKTDRLFPDEVDTPQDQHARIRFQKYRGLESFRTSPWDPKENLPSDYARIFQFQNFDRTRRRILKEAENIEGAQPGWYITISIKNVSQLQWQSYSQTGTPVVIIGLFAHEHKMSVLNVVLKRTQDYNVPIKSKERVVFQCGFRRFVVNPVFSQHTNGQKHKFERFFQPESTCVATFYAPIQFPPAPVLCYKEVMSNFILVATGSLLNCNPDRLVVKRLVLSGHPFKIFKRSAVIRFMFFNREDINYFKPCKLRTKMGRSGHIREPLGTHGHMKCVFDGQLKSQDTVLLNLYKRVFPKWTYEDLLISCNSNVKESSHTMEI